ncbi:MAG: hypothetical protein U0231_08665 [Nitrospiraceae bacterium]
MGFWPWSPPESRLRLAHLQSGRKRAEKSGNRLRIFARYLHATGKTKKKQFTVDEGGNCRFRCRSIATATPPRPRSKWGRPPSSRRRFLALAIEELIEQPIQVAGQELRFTGVSVGNHCVVFKPKGSGWSKERLRLLGPERKIIHCSPNAPTCNS